MSRHRPLAPEELEAKFRRPVELKVPPRLSLERQAALEEALAMARHSHQAVHRVSFTLQEAIAFQTGAGRHTAKEQLKAVIKASEMALEALGDQ